MTVGPITLTVGWIGRHTPPGAGVDGRDAAVIDIAQDLLLRDLHERGSLDALVFKGGTSLRKLYAGNQGRFSLDLDFSVADRTSDADTVVLQRLVENIAEKISRLNRTTTARDLYDLAWLVTHQRDIGDLDTDLIRRMVALKIWVDAHGVTAGSVRWRTGHEPRPFDPDHWLRTRAAEEVDLADIGALAVPDSSCPMSRDLRASCPWHHW